MSILAFRESTSPGQPRDREEFRKQFGKQTYFYLQLIISYRTLFSSFNSVGNLQRFVSLALDLYECFPKNMLLHYVLYHALNKIILGPS